MWKSFLEYVQIKLHCCWWKSELAVMQKIKRAAVAQDQCCRVLQRGKTWYTVLQKREEFQMWEIQWGRPNWVALLMEKWSCRRSSEQLLLNSSVAQCCNSAAECYRVLIRCCRVLQSVAECCRVLQSVAEGCRGLQSVEKCCRRAEKGGISDVRDQTGKRSAKRGCIGPWHSIRSVRSSVRPNVPLQVQKQGYFLRFSWFKQ